ncbi:MAG: SigB/SigF/SigG family RNA polymerase sigma factor [Clostridia bacterium]
MLAHEETMRLIALSQRGDEEATSTLIVENTPLLKSIIKRYTGKNVEYDDLFQISCIGLLKAIKNFSTEYNVRFSTYAVPMVLGEVKRFMRDDGYLKVSRSVKSLANKINQYLDYCRKQNINEPTVNDIATKFEVEPTDVAFALEASKMPISLYEKTTDSDGKALELIDKIAENVDELFLDKVMLREILKKLSIREQKIIILRYYRDMTQKEIADLMGVSQVQVSRLENKILDKIREEFQK